MKIREVLSRRTDLSTFVVHLTRDWVEVLDDVGPMFVPAGDSFRQIIRERLLRAITPMGWAKDQDDPQDVAKQTQRVVSFSETPLEHIWAMFVEIEDREREVKLKPYGLALTKIVARQLGVNPVWYVDMTPGHEWLARPLWQLKEEAVDSGVFHTKPAAQLFPFFDWMGGPFSENPTSKEFWWEREWRHRGPLALGPIWQKIIWLCPAAEHDEFRRLVQEATPEDETASSVFIDPAWGLEEIVAHLAGFPETDVSVFAAATADDAPDEGPPPLL
jgi:hypothetical protein